MEFKLNEEQKELLCKMHKQAGDKWEMNRTHLVPPTTYPVAVQRKLIRKGICLPPMRFDEHTIFLKHNILKELFRRGFLAAHVKKDQIRSPLELSRSLFREPASRKERECFLHCYIVEARVHIKLRECKKGVEVEDLGSVDGAAIRFKMDYQIFLDGRYTGYKKWHLIEGMTGYTIFQPVVGGIDIKDKGDGASFVHAHPRLPTDPTQESLSDGDFITLALPESTSYHGAEGAFSLDMGAFMEKAREKIKELGETAFHQEGDKRGFLNFEYISEIAEVAASICADKKSIRALYEKRGMPFVMAQCEPEGGAITVYTKLKIT